ncbi:MAG: hypothetical protein JXR33_05820 [Coriobacteriia bacterium]|nr:hypothetical protein [Coriobacteriia bacterium]
MAAAQTHDVSQYGRSRGGRVLSLLVGWFVAFLVGGPTGLVVFSAVAALAAVIVYSWRRPSPHV